MRSISLICIFILFTLACSRAMLEDALVPAASTTPIRVVLSLHITPPQSTLEIGGSTQLTAIATYSDQTTEDVTTSVNWTTTTPTISTVNNTSGKGEVWGLSQGSTTVRAYYEGASANALVRVTASSLQAIEVNPLNETIAAGVKQSYTATGIYVDSTKSDITNQVSWSVLNSSIATMSDVGQTKGQALGVSAGSTTVIAGLDGVMGSTGLTVKAVTPVSLSVTPQSVNTAIGTVTKFLATVLYSDGSSANATNSVVWTSSSTAVATISNLSGSYGYATAVAAGVTSITATLNSIAAQSSLTVNAATLDTLAITPANSTGSLGIQQRFVLTGTYSDGSTQILTDVANWTTSDLLRLLISDVSGLKGYALALLAGPVTVSATFNGRLATTVFTVNPAVLVSLDVTPTTLNLPLGLAQKLVATGTFSDASVKDLTNEVVWNSDASNLTSVSNAVGLNGTVTAAGIGTANITASLGNISGSSVITSTNALLNTISLSPTNSTLALGKTVKMVATGNYSDGTTSDISNLVTWSTNTNSILNPSNAPGFNGTIYTLLQGAGQVTATKDGVTKSTALTVTPPVLLSLTITPVTGTLLRLGVKQFKATGLYSDGSSADLTNAVSWSTSSGIGSINLLGLFLAISPGTLNVTATLNGVTKSNLINLAL